MLGKIVHNLVSSQTRFREIAMPARAGEMLFLEGNPCDYVYELRQGIARGVRITRDGERQIMAFFFAGDQLGLPISEGYRFTAEAVTDLLYIRHRRQHWHEALIRSCRDDGRLLPAICAEQDPFFRRGNIVGRHGVLIRVCVFLTSIADRLNSDGDGALHLPLPQIDIAAYLATSPESVCRAFRQLREMRVIAMPRRDHVTIIDCGQLATLASGNTTKH